MRTRKSQSVLLAKLDAGIDYDVEKNRLVLVGITRKVNVGDGRTLFVFKQYPKRFMTVTRRKK